MVKQPLLRHTAHGFRLISPAEAEARMNGRILTYEGRRGTGRAGGGAAPGTAASQSGARVAQPRTETEKQKQVTTHDSTLTAGNFTLNGRCPHNYITPFYRCRPTSTVSRACSSRTAPSSAGSSTGPAPSPAIPSCSKR